MIPVTSPFPPGLIVIVTGMIPRFHEFVDSFDALHVPDGTCKIRRGGPDCDTNRNVSIRMMPPESKWALFLDDDQEFASDTLMRLLYGLYENPGIDALTGWYVRKTPPFGPVLFKVNQPGSAQTFDRLTYRELAEARKHGPLFQIGACGGGMLLMRREALDRIGDPWFSPGPGRQWGGDLGLGGAMLHSGMKLFADLSIPVGHTMPAVITPEWDEAEQQWYVRFSFGGKGFRIPASQFKSETERV